MHRSSGLTLIEILASLAIVAAVLSLAAPALTRLVGTQRSSAALNGLLGAVQLARSAAVTRGAVVTLCGSADGASCAGRDQWHEGAIVFVDEDQDGERDAGDTLLVARPPFENGARVYWRSFRNKRYLQFDATGMTNWQNGHFLYCPAGNDPRLARQVILNAQGRARTAPDTDGDGVAEDASGRPLVCP